MNWLYLSSVNSTNTYLKDNYQKLKHWTILRADYQSKGRGRLNHVWQSHKKENLLCSILLKDAKLFKEYSSLCLIVGVSIYKLLTKLGIENVKIKLPNDIYVNHGKICGILLESIFLDDKPQALVIGIGLNLNQKSFSQRLTATSYYQIKKRAIDIDKVLKELVKILKIELEKIKPNYYQRLLKQYHNTIITK
ncbi:MAG: biotin--[acetyl-CoA-carboxylase] ligase [Bacilli bacterium]|nr:biotin--[acetyl-CoA-carboxylase] ligase [Bacilli bacterium]